MLIDVIKKIKHNTDAQVHRRFSNLKSNTFKYLKSKCVQTKFHSTAKTEMIDNLKFA